MLRFFLLLGVAALASSSAFIVHVLSAEWLPQWIVMQMEGKQVTPSWDVRYIAGVTAIEYGIGAVLLYNLSRPSLKKFHIVVRAVIISAILAMLSGALIRQPFMDLVIGNPLLVVLVQDGLKWLLWLFMGFITVVGVEAVNKSQQPDM